MDWYRTLEVQDWSEAKYIFHLLNYQWIFRGHRKAKRELRSSLLRNIPEDLDNKYLEELEESIYSRFKERAHHYLDNLPKSDELFDWLSIMQHHGAPTRLLDWTESPYVALYFAMRNVKEDIYRAHDKHYDFKENNDHCAIWAIKRDWCEEQANRIFGENQLSTKRISEFIYKNSHNFVLPIQTKRLNERMTIQQGILLCPGNIKIPFEDNFKEYSNTKDNILKILIPHKLRNEAIVELNKMNINSATLFPGLDGFAEYLGKTFISTIVDKKHIVPHAKAKETSLSRFIDSHHTFYIIVPNVIGRLNKITEIFARHDINIQSLILTKMSNKTKWIFDIKVEGEPSPIYGILNKAHKILEDELCETGHDKCNESDKCRQENKICKVIKTDRLK